MNHRIKQRKLGRTTAHRKAMLANMAAALVKHEQITTTLPKAKELRPFVEKLLTLGKKGGLANRRLIMAHMRDAVQTCKVMDVLGPRYAERPGGYTRIVKAGFRRGDAAPVAIIELVDRDPAAKGQDSGPPPLADDLDVPTEAQRAAAG
jgi:large subunit ribosomal protein L17